MDSMTGQNDRIDRRKSLEYAEFMECYMKPHKPVILVDALREWRAIERWNPQFFERTYGGVEVIVNGQVLNLCDLVRQTLESSKQNPAPYLRNYPVKDISEDLLADISPLPDYLTPNWLGTRFYPAKIRRILGRAVIPDIFIGGRGCAFPFLHYDLFNSHAFLSQIYGEKSYTLYSPDQKECLYQSPTTPNRSLIFDAMEPDLKSFPLLAAARPIRFVLGAGELLFIPAGWWHAAAVLSPSITVSINVANASNWHGLVKDQRENAIRSPRFLNRLAAAPLGAYLACVGLYRSVVPLRNEAPAGSRSAAPAQVETHPGEPGAFHRNSRLTRS